jgi:hypothetical protein
MHSPSTQSDNEFKQEWCRHRRRKAIGAAVVAVWYIALWYQAEFTAAPAALAGFRYLPGRPSAAKAIQAHGDGAAGKSKICGNLPAAQAAFTVI